MRLIWLIFIFIPFGCDVLAFGYDLKKAYAQADTYTFETATQHLIPDAQSKESRIIYGLVCLSAYQDDRAFQAFTELHRDYPDSIEAKWGIAEVHRRKHELEVSRRMLNEIIAYRDDFYPALISLAYLEFSQAHFEKSLRLALRVYALTPARVDTSNYVRALLLIAGSKGLLAQHNGVLAKLAHGKGAYSYLRKAEALQPDSAIVKLGLGSYYLLAPAIVRGDIDKARDYLTQALEKDGLLVEAYIRLAQVYKIKGNRAQYDILLKKALGIDPKNELAIDIYSGTCRFVCK